MTIAFYIPYGSATPRGMSAHRRIIRQHSDAGSVRTSVTAWMTGSRRASMCSRPDRSNGQLDSLSLDVESGRRAAAFYRASIAGSQRAAAAWRTGS